MTGVVAREGPRSPEQPIARLCASCVRDSGTDGGGVIVVSGRGTTVIAHATDTVARAVEDLQFTLGEGPTVDAVAGRAPVLVRDLTDPGREERRRWPVFGGEAESLGVRAVFAFPILAGDVALGSLDLYRRTPGLLDDDQMRSSLHASRAMGQALLVNGADRDGGTSFPMTVHRAAGMVKVQLGSSIDEALVRMRATAYLEATPVTTVALDVLEGRRRFAQEQT